MKRALIVISSIFALAGTALAGGGYDRCIKEQKALKGKEASDCSGLRYLLDPSACFKTRRLLEEYANGKCNAIAAAEQVETTPAAAGPDRRDTAVAPLQRPASAPAAPPAPTAAPVPPQNRPAGEVIVAPQKQIESPAPPAGSALEQLKAENERLKAENLRLKGEVEQLRKAAPR